MAAKTAREGAEDMQQDEPEAPAGTGTAAAGGDADADAGTNNDGEFIEAGDVAAEFEVMSVELILSTRCHVGFYRACFPAGRAACSI